MTTIAIIGASNNRDKFGNKAVRAYKDKGFEVIPINPNEKEIEGLKAYRSILDVPDDIDIASLYLPPEIGIKIIKEINEKGINKIYLNQGTESDELIKECKKYEIKPLLQCSILAIGKNPSNY